MGSQTTSRSLLRPQPNLAARDNCILWWLSYRFPRSSSLENASALLCLIEKSVLSHRATVEAANEARINYS